MCGRGGNQVFAKFHFSWGFLGPNLRICKGWLSMNHLSDFAQTLWYINKKCCTFNFASTLWNNMTFTQGSHLHCQMDTDIKYTETWLQGLILTAMSSNIVHDKTTSHTQRCIPQNHKWGIPWFISLKNRFYQPPKNLLLLQCKTFLQKGSLMWTKSDYI